MFYPTYITADDFFSYMYTHKIDQMKLKPDMSPKSSIENSHITVANEWHGDEQSELETVQLEEESHRVDLGQ